MLSVYECFYNKIGYSSREDYICAALKAETLQAIRVLRVSAKILLLLFGVFVAFVVLKRPSSRLVCHMLFVLNVTGGIVTLSKC